MRQIRARAPLRLGLAGGGTDVSPYCDQFGGQVINVTINKYAYACLEERRDDRVRFEAADYQVAFEGGLGNLDSIPPALILHYGVYSRIIRDFRGGRLLPVTLTTFSEAPAGSGLGSSSTMVVAMVEAFRELLDLPLGDYDVAHLAYEIERVDLGLTGGKQDQYAATFGGLNFMEFYAGDRVIVNPLRLKDTITAELEASLVLFFTGISRTSASIIDEQVLHVRNRDSASIEAMHALKQEAQEMKYFLLRGDIRGLAETLGRGWKSKKRIASQITTPFIEKVYNLAVDAGAYSGKVSGAGGGGFMMFVVDPPRRPSVMCALDTLGEGKVTTCQLVEKGAMAWWL